MLPFFSRRLLRHGNLFNCPENKKGIIEPAARAGRFRLCLRLTGAERPYGKASTISELAENAIGVLASALYTP